MSDTTDPLSTLCLYVQVIHAVVVIYIVIFC